MTTTVLFVGRRIGALRAARALGLRVACVDEKAPGPRAARRIVRFLPCDLAAREHDDHWRAIAGRLADVEIDAVFSLIEGSVLPAARLRRHLGLPGDDVETARRCTDKLLMKRAVAAAGIPCARFAGGDEGSKGEGLERDRLIDALGLPMVIKARVGSGGRTNRVARTRDEVPSRLPEDAIAESFVEGVEMSVEALVQSGRVLFTNPTAYLRPRWANVLPATLEPTVHDDVLELLACSLDALGVRDAFVHLELFLTPGGAVFGELAVRPPGGYIMELIALAYGFDPWRAWLRAGLGQRLEPAELRADAVRTAGVWVLHPGPGTVTSVAGGKEARALPGVERVHLRLAPGQRIGPRLGAGQDVGHIIAIGDDATQVAARLELARDAIRIGLTPA